MSSETTQFEDVGEMKRRRITLEDGRYLIFYTFEQSHDSVSSGTGAQSKQPETKTESAEERNV